MAIGIDLMLGIMTVLYLAKVLYDGFFLEKHSNRESEISGKFAWNGSKLREYEAGYFEKRSLRDQRVC